MALYVWYDMWSVCRLYELYWRYDYISKIHVLWSHKDHIVRFSILSILHGPRRFMWTELIRGTPSSIFVNSVCACVVAPHSNGGHVWSVIVFFCAVILSCALNTPQLSPRHPWVDSCRALLTHMIGVLCVSSDFMCVLVCGCRCLQ